MKPKIKLPDPFITEQNIWEGDQLGRKQYAQNICEMLADETEPIVVAVNGKWGCGKTFFLERFAKEYEKDGKGGVCIYLNAWECDYLSNPLLFLLSGIQEMVSDPSKGALFDPQLLEQFTELLKKIAKNMLGKIPWGIGEGIKETIETNPLCLYSQQTKLNNQLRQLLSERAKDIKSRTGKPMVICVDELDRCRPTYAIEMLERIKHFFDIPGIVFLLGLDREQLCASIASVYGNIDTENYLHRFFDIEFILPPPQRDSFIAAKFKEYNLETYWTELDRGNNIGICAGEGNEGRKIFQLLAEIHRLELREIQTALKWLVVLIRSQKAHCHSFPDFGVILIILKLRNRQLAEQYLKGLATPADVLDFLLPKEPETIFWRNDYSAAKRIVAAVYCSFTRSRNENIFFDALQHLSRKENLRDDQIVALPWFLNNPEEEVLDACIKKISIMSRVYDYDALKDLATRLETFGWQTGR